MMSLELETNNCGWTKLSSLYIYVDTKVYETIRASVLATNRNCVGEH